MSVLRNRASEGGNWASTRNRMSFAYPTKIGWSKYWAA